MLALRMDAKAPLIDHVLWAPGAYLVPRRDGRLIVGATVEEKGFDDTITAGGVMALLDAAWRAVPAVEELPIDEIWVGHRPGSRDDAPILGPGPLDGLFYATGHHRNGILLAPVTADAMARLILDNVVEPAIRPFGLERFSAGACGGVGKRDDASGNPRQRRERTVRRAKNPRSAARGKNRRHRPARHRGGAQRRRRSARGVAGDAA